MTKFFKYYWWDVKYFWYCLLDKSAMAVAFMLPRWLVYRATVRLIAHGTTGFYSHTEVSNVRAVTLLKRWDTSNE